jgi:hypothetical protein
MSWAAKYFGGENFAMLGVSWVEDEEEPCSSSSSNLSSSSSESISSSSSGEPSSSSSGEPSSSSSGEPSSSSSGEPSSSSSISCFLFGSILLDSEGVRIAVQDIKIGQRLKGYLFNTSSFESDNNPNFDDLLVSNRYYSGSQLKESQAIVEEISYGYDKDFYKISDNLTLTYEHPLLVAKNNYLYFKSISNVKNNESVVSCIYSNVRFLPNNITYLHREGFTVSIKVSGANTLVSDGNILVHSGQYKSVNYSSDFSGVKKSGANNVLFNDESSVYFGDLESYLTKLGKSTMFTMQDSNAVLFLNNIEDSSGLPGGNDLSFVFGKDGSSSSSSGNGNVFSFVLHNPTGDASGFADSLGITLCDSYESALGSCDAISSVDIKFNINLGSELTCNDCFIKFNEYLSTLYSSYENAFIYDLNIQMKFTPYGQS